MILLIFLRINSLLGDYLIKTLNYFIKHELWDEARIFTSKQKFKKGIKSPEFYAPLFSKEELGDNTLKIYFN